MNCKFCNKEGALNEMKLENGRVLNFCDDCFVKAKLFVQDLGFEYDDDAIEG